MLEHQASQPVRQILPETICFGLAIEPSGLTSVVVRPLKQPASLGWGNISLSREGSTQQSNVHRHILIGFGCMHLHGFFMEKIFFCRLMNADQNQKSQVSFARLMCRYMVFWLCASCF